MTWSGQPLVISVIIYWLFSDHRAPIKAIFGDLLPFSVALSLWAWSQPDSRPILARTAFGTHTRNAATESQLFAGQTPKNIKSALTNALHSMDRSFWRSVSTVSMWAQQPKKKEKKRRNKISYPSRTLVFVSALFCFRLFTLTAVANCSNRKPVTAPLRFWVRGQAWRKTIAADLRPVRSIERRSADRQRLNIDFDHIWWQILAMSVRRRTCPNRNPSGMAAPSVCALK